MSTRVSLNRPMTLQENVKDVPVIKQGPSISKVSPGIQGNWMDSTAMRAAALFYVTLSVILFMASPSMGAHTDKKGRKSYSILSMAFLFANLIVSIKVAQYVYSLGNH